MFGIQIKGTRWVAVASMFLAAGEAARADVQLYFSSSNNNTIYALASNGTVSPYVTAGLSAPGGLAFDSVGNLYVANYSSGTVSKIAPGGVVSFYAGGFDHPFGLVFDPQGNLYVSNTGDGAGTTVSKITPGATSVSTYGTGFSQPEEMAFDTSGDLFVADYATGWVSKVAPGGGVAAPFANVGNGAYGMAIDQLNNLYVGVGSHVSYQGSIYQVTPAGGVSIYATGVEDPYGMSIDPAADIYLGTDYPPLRQAEIMSVTSSGNTILTSGLISATDVIFVVPEPTSAALLISFGCLALAIRRRRSPSL